MAMDTEEEYGFPESDWRLFRKKLPVWQQDYMGKLIEEYKDILNGEGSPSDKFWELEKRIKQDRRDTGVTIDRVSRSRMIDILISLYREGAITSDDLDDFSDTLKDQLTFLKKDK